MMSMLMFLKPVCTGIQGFPQVLITWRGLQNLIGVKGLELIYGGAWGVKPTS